MAVNFRSNWPTEIDTETPDEALALLELEPPLGADVEDDELQAAAARHNASDAEAATAPFLAVLIM